VSTLAPDDPDAVAFPIPAAIAGNNLDFNVPGNISIAILDFLW
jgi:hypothetical protein